MMKRKILVLTLVMILLLAYAAPVTATEEAVVLEATESINVVSEDADIQAAFDAYKDMIEGMKANEAGPMTDAYQKLEALTADFTDQQSQEWSDIVDKNFGVEEYLSNAINAATIIETIKLRDDYMANPNAKTAYDFVRSYDQCLEYGISSIGVMADNLETNYNAAKTNHMPSENVVKVFEAHESLTQAMETGLYDEDFVAACKAFEAVLDAFNDLTEEELNDLALLMGVADGEAAFQNVFSHWINANMILQLGKVYDAYMANPNAETAAALVKEYNSIFGATDLFTKEDFQLFRTFFGDIDDVYAEAKDKVKDNDKEKEQDKKQDTLPTEEPDMDESPDAGDDTNGAVPLTVMLAAVGIAAATLKRKSI